MLMNTPENITELLSNQIFVFGSNEAWKHSGWAARIAYDKFNAEWGIWEWLTGQCYALPTLDWNFRKRTISQLRDSIDLFIEICNQIQDKQFLLTKVWCWIAWFKEEEIKELFKFTPKNVVKPIGW